ncbi:MAG: hypothetical protein H6731_04830 [Myxococcales bacterium]|nr:MAG: hypothetical protein H6731_04830 [Myxococcales bacterium]
MSNKNTKLCVLFFGLTLGINVMATNNERTQYLASELRPSLNLNDQIGDFYWGQSFIQSASSYVYNLGNYTVDISKRTYDKLFKLSKYYTNTQAFDNFVKGLYSTMSDSLSDAIVDLTLDTISNYFGLPGADPLDPSSVLAEDAFRETVKEVARYLNVVELPKTLSDKIYTFVMSYKKK